MNISTIDDKYQLYGSCIAGHGGCRACVIIGFVPESAALGLELFGEGEDSALLVGFELFQFEVVSLLDIYFLLVPLILVVLILSLPSLLEQLGVFMKALVCVDDGLLDCAISFSVPTC